MQDDFPVASHNQLKKWGRLTQTKFRREDGLFIAEGVKVVEELLKSDWPVESVLVLPEKKAYWEKIIAPAKDRAPVYQLKRPEWKKFSQDKEPEGLIAIVKFKERPSLPQFLQSSKGHILILHEINNPGNLGALVRTACWFGFGGMIIGSSSVDWTHPKVIRSSMGSIFHLAVLSEMDLSAVLPELKKDRLLIVSDTRKGFAPYPPAKKAALVLGSESHGLPDHMLGQADERWRIPGCDRVDSLSLPQAAAIMMYEMAKGG